jgi:hypothetical protein
VAQLSKTIFLHVQVPSIVYGGDNLIYSEIESDQSGQLLHLNFTVYIKENPKLNSKSLKDDEKTKLMCLSGVKQYPMRVKCATLSWHTLISAIDNTQEKINTERLD